jgi:hypothetical protein
MTPDLATLARAVDLAVIAHRRERTTLSRAELERCAAAYDRARLELDCQVPR